MRNIKREHLLNVMLQLLAKATGTSPLDTVKSASIRHSSVTGAQQTIQCRRTRKPASVGLHAFLHNEYSTNVN